MAFEKTIRIPSGYDATYIKLGPYNIDPARREAKAQFHFFKDQATADANGAQACPQIAVLRLEREAFDRWFSKEAKAAAVTAGLTIDDAAIFYRAARKENVVCDFGAMAYHPKKNPEDKDEPLRPSGYRDLFSDALDV